MLNINKTFDTWKQPPAFLDPTVVCLTTGTNYCTKAIAMWHGTFQHSAPHVRWNARQTTTIAKLELARWRGHCEVLHIKIVNIQEEWTLVFSHTPSNLCKRLVLHIQTFSWGITMSFHWTEVEWPSSLGRTAFKALLPWAEMPHGHVSQ